MKLNYQNILVSLLLLLGGNAAMATLTVTIAPGYQFGSGERPTTSTLNLLGLPTATITGTVDGSTGLSAGSVTGTLLADSVADGVTINYNSSSPRALAVTVAGLYNGGGGITSTGAYLRVNLDPSYFRLATNSLANTNANTGSTLTNWITFAPTNGSIGVTAIVMPTNTLVVGSTNGNGGTVFYSPQFNVANQTNVISALTNSGPTFQLTTFTSPTFALPSTGTLVTNIAHGFSNTPVAVRWVLVNQRAEIGYFSNDEVAVENCYAFSGGNGLPGFNAGANRTNVFIAANSSGTLTLLNRQTGSGAGGSITPSNWLVKCYARP